MSTAPDYDFADVVRLLQVDRELTADEMAILAEFSSKSWADLTPVSSGILLERKRLRELWLEVERAGEASYVTKMENFRRALGLED